MIQKTTYPVVCPFCCYNNLHQIIIFLDFFLRTPDRSAVCQEESASSSDEFHFDLFGGVRVVKGFMFHHRDGSSSLPLNNQQVQNCLVS